MEWFRAYHRALDNKRVQSLSRADRGSWWDLLCLASQQPVRGLLPDVGECAFRLRMSADEMTALLKTLRKVGLVERAPRPAAGQMYNWDKLQPVSDDVTTRVQRHRERRRGNVPFIEGETDPRVTETRPPVTGNVSRNVSPAPPSSPPRTPPISPRDSEGRREGEAEESDSTVQAAPTEAQRLHSAPSKPSPSIEPLKAAFKARGLRVPAFGAGEAANAQALLEAEGCTPELLVQCWQDHAGAAYPLADNFSRRDLSFGYLAVRQRYFNWLTWHEAGRKAEPHRNGKANGAVKPATSTSSELTAYRSNE